MPSPKKYDTTINCGPADSENPLTLIKRGPVEIAVKYEDPMEPKSDFFVEVKLGKRRVRTAWTKYHDHMLVIGEVLEHLGFTPLLISGKADMDEEYD
jgi:hypothetical protein